LVLLTFGPPSATHARSLYKIISAELEFLTVEDGSKSLLSVDELQQFVPVRFFYNNLSLLVLGEPNDNPVTQSKVKIWETFENFKEKITTLFVSNRSVSKNILNRLRELKTDEYQFEEVKR
jgi:ABC-type lipoprotein export system ATPase subunit